MSEPFNIDPYYVRASCRVAFPNCTGEVRLSRVTPTGWPTVTSPPLRWDCGVGPKAFSGSRLAPAPLHLGPGAGASTLTPPHPSPGRFSVTGA